MSDIDDNKTKTVPAVEDNSCVPDSECLLEQPHLVKKDFIHGLESQESLSGKTATSTPKVVGTKSKLSSSFHSLPPPHFEDDDGELNELYILGENHRLISGSRKMEEEYKKQVEELEQRLAECENQLAKFRSDAQRSNDDANNNYKNLLAEIEERDKEIEHVNNLNEGLRKLLEEREGDVEGVPDSTYVSPQLLSTGSTSQDSAIGSEISTLKQQSDALKQANTNLIVRLERLTGEKEDLEKYCEERSLDHVTLKNKMKEMVEEHQKEMENIRGEKEYMVEEVREVQSQKSELQARLDSVKMLRAKQGEKDSQIEQVQAKLHQKEELLQKSVMKNNEMQSQLSSLTAEVEGKRSEVNHLREMLSERSINTSESNINKELKLIKENEGLKTQLDTYKVRMEAVNNVHKALEAQRSAVDEMKARIKEKEATILQLQVENQNLEAVFGETLSEKEQNSKRILELDSSCQILKEEFEHWKANAEQQYTETCQEYETRIERLYDQLEKYTSYPGKEAEGTLSETANATAWEAIPTQIRDALQSLRVESKGIAAMIQQLQNSSLVNLTLNNELISSAQDRPPSSSDAPDCISVEDLLRPKIARIVAGLKHLSDEEIERQPSCRGNRLSLLKVICSSLGKLFDVLCDNTKDDWKNYIDDCMSDFHSKLVLSATALPPSIPTSPKGIGRSQSNRMEEKSRQLEANVVSLRRENEEMQKKCDTQLKKELELMSVNERLVEECDSLERRLREDKELIIRLEDDNIKLAKSAESLQTKMSDLSDTIKERNYEIEENQVFLDKARMEKSSLELQYTTFRNTSEMLQIEAVNTITEISKVLEEEKEVGRGLREEVSRLQEMVETQRRRLIDDRAQEDIATRDTALLHTQLIHQERKKRTQLENLILNLQKRISSQSRQLKKSEERRKALVFQKRYLKEYVMERFEKTAKAAERVLSEELKDYGRRLGLEKVEGVKISWEVESSSPKAKFRSAVYSVIAALRFQRSGRRWRRCFSGSSSPASGPPSYREISGHGPTTDGPKIQRDGNQNFLDLVPSRHSSRTSKSP